MSHPAITVVPKTDQDILSAIRVAKQNNLQLIPVAGNHGSFVPIGSSTMVVDMKLFKSIELDRDNGSVCVGGGVTAGELLKAVANEGFYVPFPSSNAVGVVGAILGGGNSGMNGLHGFIADSVVSLTVVTADERVVDVHPCSTREELALFNALRGAGHGLGIVTSVIMKAYPISSLRLTGGDKVWTRTMIFPPPALGDVAKAFGSFQPPAEKLNVFLTFIRSPPGTPAAGAPIIILAATYFGPADEAEKATPALFDSKLVEKAIKADTAFVPLASSNDALGAVNVHGGHKSMVAARLKTLEPPSITQTFAAWVKATDDIDDSKRTAAVYHCFNTVKLQVAAVGQQDSGPFVEGRDRGYLATISTWTSNPASHSKLMQFVDSALALNRAGDSAPPRTYPNGMKFNANRDELFSKDRLAQISQLKNAWDPAALFWSPYM